MPGARSAPRSVLVVVTRRIGDVLLTTPLIRTLKRAWPDTAIDVLVFAGTAGVLASNPDIRGVLTIAERPGWLTHAKFLCQICRRYDIALSVVPSDRPTLYAWLAGRWRAGLVADEPKHAWKKWLLQRWIAFDNLETHTVTMVSALARTLDLEPQYEVVAGWSDTDKRTVESMLPFAPSASYAVLHTFPKFNYKMWHRDGWIDVAEWLRVQGLQLVLSGSGDAAEREYVGALAREISGSVDLSGRLTLPQTAYLFSHARVYVGPDTAPTHMAAAAGIPVVALYGPSDPVKWGPFPAGTAATKPWRRCGSQTAGNVTLVQGLAACVPCLKEGCDRHIASFSDCLQALTAQTVIAALTQALTVARPLRTGS
jgi:heptosyltransferase-3